MGVGVAKIFLYAWKGAPPLGPNLLICHSCLTDKVQPFHIALIENSTPFKGTHRRDIGSFLYFSLTKHLEILRELPVWEICTRYRTVFQHFPPPPPMHEISTLCRFV